VPTFGFQTRTDYVYNYAWHTLNDLYSELVPYTDQQQESAVMTAVVAYGAANLDRRLPNEGVYLADGLYADITTVSGARIMTTLDFVNAPLQAANFIRITEGKTGPPAGGGRGGGPAGPPPAAAGGRAGVPPAAVAQAGGGRAGVPPAAAGAGGLAAPAAQGAGRGEGGRGGQAPQGPPIGTVDVRGGLVSALIVSDVQKAAALKALPKTANAAIPHDGVGVLGMSAPNAFYLTLQKNPGLDKKYTAIGKVIAGEGLLQGVKKGDGIRIVRITRVGQAARDFKVDDATFKQMLDKATTKK
jgi:hypothetical protein